MVIVDDLMNVGDLHPPSFSYLLSTFKKKLGKANLEKMLTNFKPDKTLEEMTSFLWAQEEVHCYVSPVKGDGGKQLDKALQLREAADVYLGENAHDKAIELYNLALSLSPQPKLVLPFERVCPSHGEFIDTDVPKTDYKEFTVGLERKEEVVSPSSPQKNLTGTERGATSKQQPNPVVKTPDKHFSSAQDKPKTEIADTQQIPKLDDGEEARKHSSVRPKEKLKASLEVTEAEDGLNLDSSITLEQGEDDLGNIKRINEAVVPLEDELLMIVDKWKIEDKEDESNSEPEKIKEPNQPSDETYDSSIEVPNNSNWIVSSETIIGEDDARLKEEKDPENGDKIPIIQDKGAERLEEDIEDGEKRHITQDQGAERLEEDIEDGEKRNIIQDQGAEKFEEDIEDVKMHIIHIIQDKGAERLEEEKNAENGEKKNIAQEKGAERLEEDIECGEKKIVEEECVGEKSSQKGDGEKFVEEPFVEEPFNPKRALMFRNIGRTYEMRAVSLYTLKEYERCLRDMRLAVKFGSKGIFANVAIAALNNSELGLAGFRALVEEEIAKGTKRKCKERGLIFTFGVSSPPVLEEPSLEIPALSSAVKRKYLLPEGRFLAATRDIKPGEILGVEDPYCYIVNGGELMKFCAKCLQRCVTAIPCCNCCVVVFCSEECSLKDETHPHWPLCNHVLPSLVSMKMDSIVMLAAQVLTHLSFLKLKETIGDLKQEKEELAAILRGNDADGVYRSSSYRSVYHLEGNETKCTDEERFDAGLQAFALTLLLKDSKRYFVMEDKSPFLPTDEDVLLTSATAFRHLLNLKCSAVSLAELRVLTTEPEKSWSSCIGCGVYPSITLANHSCNPNTTLYNHGKTLVMVSTRSIAKNMPLTLSYVNQFRLVPGVTRRSVLRENYQFDCICEACKEDWFPDIDDIFEMRCLTCGNAIDVKKGMCNACNIPYREGKDIKNPAPYNLFFMRDKLHQASSNCKKIKLKILSQGDCMPKDRATIISSIELMEKYVKEPCSMLLTAQEVLRLSFERDGSWTSVKERKQSWLLGPAYLINSNWIQKGDVYRWNDSESYGQSPTKRKGRSKSREEIPDTLPVPPPYVPVANPLM